MPRIRYRIMITREWLLSLSYSGKYKCPECSHKRRNKADRSLSVTIQPDSVVCYCHHCGKTLGANKGGNYAQSNRERDSIRKEKRDIERNPALNAGRKWHRTIW